ncbi:Ribonuclease III [Forsythia ovata]|uniref:Ribonuclease III n=1 Tax=Forsythia ovata TaxID=205694 RepID=A0ABD1QCY7_9LAMI
MSSTESTDEDDAQDIEDLGIPHNLLERELLEDYFLPFINHEELPANASKIFKTNLYKFHPQFFGMDEPIPWKAIVFTPIPRKTKYSLVADRKTKTGFWKIKKGPKLVPYGLDMVAYKREFDFYEVNTLRGRFTGISMIEYRLTNRPGNNVNGRFVLVMTPQILLHNLSHCFIRIEIIALLIFDECRYAQLESNHPYAEIMKIFYKADMAKLPYLA